MTRRILIAITALVALVPASAASAAVDRTVEVAAGKSETWAGTKMPGTNLNYFNVTTTGDTVLKTGTCTKDPQTYCDLTLVALSNPVPADDADGKLRRTATFTISDYAGPAADVDMELYASDETGARGDSLGGSTEFTTETEQASVAVTTTLEEPTKYVLVQVIYFVQPGTGYTGDVKF